ncbi:hypothetical protein FHR84_004209 [Actinopolyspora biskrensis]|uniref:Uncharacterized protein n=1 Tax=Actinopolyspora biskrensis TaxID=1470178 RepID=A0A852Z220_9ACTN|nr:hypothetical protein [Actinopolyspora biskrensis]NYH80841.1 hypothetical protein [Actinopolyspora biskrensis]
MQTWARRGVQAALVTGGMLAAGTGVASASGDCPERPTSPLDEPRTPAEAAGDGTPSRSGLCFAGELFPDQEETRILPALGGERELDARLAEAETLVGTIAPITDEPVEAENERTLRIPRITEERAPDPAADTERQWIPPQELPERHRSREAPTSGPASAGTDSPAGAAAPSAHLTRGHVSTGKQPRERSRGRHAADSGDPKPAEGFHRSLSWSGPIGSVSETGPSGEAEDVDRAEPRRSALVVPSSDPAESPGLSERSGGLLSMWRQANPDGMLATSAVDLTSVGFETGPDLRTVPDEVFRSALSTRTANRVRAAEDSAPLELPGEVHQRVEEIPADVDPALLFSEFPGEAAAEPTRGPDAGTTLPGFGELNTLGGNSEAGEFSRVARALNVDGPDALRGSAPEEEIRFSAFPELSPATVRAVDELAAAMPERKQVASNPFRETTTTRNADRDAERKEDGGMALPVLGKALSFQAAEGMTMPLPALDANGTPRFGAPDTAAMPRGAYSRA